MSGPTPAVQITRRTFIHRSVLAGAAGAATYGWFPLINTLDFAYGQQAPFRFAWVSDNHLYPKDVNTRFVEKTVRAFKEVQAMSPAADFMIHGGDLAQLGDPVELDLGADLLKEVQDPEGLHPRRARLVPRHGPEVDRPLRPAQLDVRPQGRPVRGPRHRDAGARTTGRPRR